MRDEILRWQLDDDKSRRQVVLVGDIPGIFRNLGILLLTSTVVIEALLLFRFWSQISASVPDTAPGSWLYGLGGFVVSYFAAFEVGPTSSQSTVLELSLLVAVGFFLVAGTAAAVGCFQASKSARSRWPDAFEVPLGTETSGRALWLRDLRTITAMPMRPLSHPSERPHDDAARSRRLRKTA